jgi:antitoxin protein of toxin-antitoxin system
MSLVPVSCPRPPDGVLSPGRDKAGEFADEKTGGQYGDKIDQGTDFAKDQLDNLDGQDDDIPDDQS